ncbi:uncharacterized protein LDX57_003365 [Aspergillus melleus]|uniref:uncharacterized protein n=1 Tax=Aspergillus melleus TaxID=138277 RepID=UPI001E8DB547|nr:uncharacterized protein LDX57_003365 [Aspergillus melleus]KAH8425616.1 hypothetical protein LDX57_003365 [Aspergillus melleus]
MKTPTPTNHLRFDPWTTSSTGHQVADSAASKAYRTLRQEKLARQFGEGQGDCTFARARSAAGTGAGELERGTWVEVTYDRNKNAGLGRGGQRDIRGMFGVAKASSVVDMGVKESKVVGGGKPLLSSLGDGVKGSSVTATAAETPHDPHPSTTSTSTAHPNNELEPETKTNPVPNSNPPDSYPQIFTTLTIYINAPSHPLLSDHKLKQILTLHGATIALSLSRRVTHIIVGKPNTRSGHGFGGGLAGGKLQREITRAGCRSWKVVFVEWVLESIKAGKRLSEARFAMQMAEKRQRSVLAFTAGK